MTSSRQFWGLACLGGLLRVWLMVLVPHVLAGDAWHNHMIALNLLAGHGFSHSPVPPWYPDCLRSPAYPLLVLAPCYLFAGPSQVAVGLAQIALDVGSGWFVYRLLSAEVSPRVGVVAAGLFFLAPYEGAYASLELTETLATFLLAAWLYGIRQSPRVGAPANALLGLCRPAFLPLVLAAPWLTGGRLSMPRRLALYWLLPALCLSPWVVRNYLTFGQLSLTNVGSVGVSLYFGVAVDGGIHLTDEGQAELAVDMQQWSRDHDVPAAVALDVDQRLKRIAIDAIRAHPVEWSVHVLHQALRLWWDADDGVQDYQSDVPMDQLVLLANVMIWCQRALLLLALAGAVRTGLHRPIDRLFLVVVVVMTLCYATIHVEARYSLPAETILAALSASLLTPRQKAGEQTPAL